MTDVILASGVVAKIDDVGAQLLSGQVVLVWCQGCHVSFTWECLNANDVPPRYHSDNCRKRNTKRLKEGTFLPCPTPTKTRYKTGLDAEQAFREVRDRERTPYRCRCGSYHLGHHTWVIVGG